MTHRAAARARLAALERSEAIVEYFNDLLRHDREAVTALFDCEVDVGKCLATNPLARVSRVQTESGDLNYSFGPLGLVNGLLEGVLNEQMLRVVYDQDTGRIKWFEPAGLPEDTESERGDDV